MEENQELSVPNEAELISQLTAAPRAPRPILRTSYMSFQAKIEVFEIEVTDASHGRGLVRQWASQGYMVNGRDHFINYTQFIEAVIVEPENEQP